MRVGLEPSASFGNNRIARPHSGRAQPVAVTLSWDCIRLDCSGVGLSSGPPPDYEQVTHGKRKARYAARHTLGNGGRFRCYCWNLFWKPALQGFRPCTDFLRRRYRLCCLRYRLSLYYVAAPPAHSPLLAPQLAALFFPETPAFQHRAPGALSLE